MIKTPLQQTTVGQQWSTMGHLKLKRQETRPKKYTVLHQYIYLTWQCSEKQTLKSPKWTLMINYFLHERKTRKDFMILVFKTRLKKQSHFTSRVSFYKFSMLNYSLKQNSNYVLLISFAAWEQMWNLSSVANPKSTKKMINYQARENFWHVLENWDTCTRKKNLFFRCYGNFFQVF